MNNSYDVIMLITEKNMHLLHGSIDYIRKNLNAEEIIGIAPERLKTEIRKLGITFLNEDNIIDGLTFDTVKQLINDLNLDVKRTGWYFQQFLKLGYCTVTCKEYYLTWDSDTIPLHSIQYFKNNKPCFVEKKEYHGAYFNTLKKLMENKVYRVDRKISYIAENMLFKTSIVSELLNAIENNNNIPGDSFYSKIISSIDPAEFESGFSEFETYGNYVRIFHPQLYGTLKLKTLRHGSLVIGNNPNYEQLKWAEKEYDIISFEGREIFLSKLTKLGLFRKLIRLSAFSRFIVSIRNIRRKAKGLEDLNYD